MKKTADCFSKRKILASLFLGIITAFVFAAGKSLDRYESIDFGDMHLWIRFGVFFLISTVVFDGAWMLLDRLFSMPENAAKERKIPFPVMTAVMFVFWVPYLLSIFPGAFSYDAYDEWKMVADANFSVHHPLIHVLILGGLTQGAKNIFGSYNLGIAVYSILQMLSLALLFSLLIHKINKRFASLKFQIFSLAYFSLAPVIGLFSVSAIKDTLFCAVEMLFFYELFCFYSDKEAYLAKKKNIISLAVFGFFTMILRNNGLYIVLVCVAVLFFSSLKLIRKCAKSFLLFFAVLLIPFILYSMLLPRLLHADGAKAAEKLSVPLQQMARVYKYNRAELPEDEVKLLHEFVPEENLTEYKPTVSDLVKSGFDNERYKQNPKDFYRLWFTWGKRYPMTYVASFLINTVDGWYPGAVIDGYRFEGKSSYFDYRVAEPGEEKTVLSGFHHLLDRISHETDAQKGVGFVLLFSPGTYLLFFLFLWFYAIGGKKKAFAFAGILHVVHYLTLLLGPMALVRYELNFFYGVPVFLWCLATEAEAQSDKQTDMK